MFRPCRAIFKYIICLKLFHCIFLLSSKALLKLKLKLNTSKIRIIIKTEISPIVPLEVEYCSALVVCGC
jgi:hypothetical protein